MWNLHRTLVLSLSGYAACVPWAAQNIYYTSWQDSVTLNSRFYTYLNAIQHLSKTTIFIYSKKSLSILAYDLLPQ